MLTERRKKILDSHKEEIEKAMADSNNDAVIAYKKVAKGKYCFPTLEVFLEYVDNKRKDEKMKIEDFYEELSEKLDKNALGVVYEDMRRKYGSNFPDFQTVRRYANDIRNGKIVKEEKYDSFCGAHKNEILDAYKATGSAELVRSILRSKYEEIPSVQTLKNFIQDNKEKKETTKANKEKLIGGVPMKEVAELLKTCENYAELFDALKDKYHLTGKERFRMSIKQTKELIPLYVKMMERPKKPKTFKEIDLNECADEVIKLLENSDSFHEVYDTLKKKYTLPNLEAFRGRILRNKNNKLRKAYHENKQSCHKDKHDNRKYIFTEHVDEIIEMSKKANNIPELYDLISQNNPDSAVQCLDTFRHFLSTCEAAKEVRNNLVGKNESIFKEHLEEIAECLMYMAVTTAYYHFYNKHQITFSYATFRRNIKKYKKEIQEIQKTIELPLSCKKNFHDDKIATLLPIYGVLQTYKIMKEEYSDLPEYNPFHYYVRKKYSKEIRCFSKRDPRIKNDFIKEHKDEILEMKKTMTYKEITKVLKEKYNISLSEKGLNTSILNLQKEVSEEPVITAEKEDIEKTPIIIIPEKTLKEEKTEKIADEIDISSRTKEYTNEIFVVLQNIIVEATKNPDIDLKLLSDNISNYLIKAEEALEEFEKAKASGDQYKLIKAYQKIGEMI